MRKFFIGLLSLLAVQSLASAGPIILIDDYYTNPPKLLGNSPYGFDPATLSIQRSVDPITGVESLDLHGEWVSSTVKQPGTVVVANFNFYGEPGEPNIPNSYIGDTLAMTFSWQTPTGNDLNNVSLDMHFRSDGDLIDPLTGLPIGLPELVNATFLPETFGWMDLTQYIIAAGGPADQVTQVLSAAPEPASMTLLGLSIAALAGYRLRRRNVVAIA